LARGLAVFDLGPELSQEFADVMARLQKAPQCKRAILPFVLQMILRPASSKALGFLESSSLRGCRRLWSRDVLIFNLSLYREKVVLRRVGVRQLTLLILLALALRPRVCAISMSLAEMVQDHFQCVHKVKIANGLASRLPPGAALEVCHAIQHSRGARQ